MLLFTQSQKPKNCIVTSLHWKGNGRKSHHINISSSVNIINQLNQLLLLTSLLTSPHTQQVDGTKLSTSPRFPPLQSGLAFIQQAVDKMKLP